MHVNVFTGGDIGGRYPHRLSIFNDLTTLGDSLDGDLMGKGELILAQTVLPPTVNSLPTAKEGAMTMAMLSLACIIITCSIRQPFR